MGRAYVSPLRQRQLASTRRRIVDGVARVLARGLTELSIPAVANEAEVSVATVYRHFKNKQELVAGLEKHYAEQMGIDAFIEGTGTDVTLEELLDALPRLFLQRERLDPTLRSAVASELVGEYRLGHIAERLAPIEKLLKQRFPERSEEELEHLRNLLALLTSAAGLRAFKAVAGLSADTAAASSAWAIRRLLAIG